MERIKSSRNSLRELSILPEISARIFKDAKSSPLQTPDSTPVEISKLEIETMEALGLAARIQAYKLRDPNRNSRGDGVSNGLHRTRY